MTKESTSSKRVIGLGIAFFLMLGLLLLWLYVSGPSEDQSSLAADFPSRNRKSSSAEEERDSSGKKPAHQDSASKAKEIQSGADAQDKESGETTIKEIVIDLTDGALQEQEPRVELDLVPTLDGKPALWFLKKLESIYVSEHTKEPNKDTPGASLSYNNNESYPARYSGSGAGFANVRSIEISIFWYPRMANRDFGGLVYEQLGFDTVVQLGEDETLNLGRFEFSIAEFVAPSHALVLMQVRHPSGLALDSISPVFQAESESLGLAGYNTSIRFEIDESGFAYGFFPLQSESGSRLQSRLDADALKEVTFRYSGGGKAASFRRKIGQAYDFGELTIGGAFLQIDVQYTLPSHFSFGKETKVTSKAVVLGEDWCESELEIIGSFISGHDDFWIYDSEYLGKGLERASIHLPAGDYEAELETSSLDRYSPLRVYAGKESIRLRDGEFRTLSISAQVPDLGVLLIENKETPNGGFYKIVGGLPDEAPKSFGAFRKEASKVYSDTNYILFSQDEWFEEALVGWQSDISPHCLVGSSDFAYEEVEYTKAFQIKTIKLHRPWPEVTKVEEEEDDSQTREIQVLFDLNGYEPPGDAYHKLSVGTDSWRSPQDLEKGEKLEIPRFVDNQFSLYEYSASGGYAPDKPVAEFLLTVSNEAKTITLKFTKPPFANLSKGAITYLTMRCEDTPVFSSSWEIDTARKAYQPNERWELSGLLFSHDDKATRVSANEYLIEFPARKRLILGPALFERFSSVKVVFEEGRIAANKPGQYSLPKENWSIWQVSTYSGSENKSAALFGVYQGREVFIQSLDLYGDRFDDGKGTPPNDQEWHEDDIISVDFTPTIVKVDGLSGGYTWTLVRSGDGPYWESPRLTAGLELALLPGSYVWIAKLNEQVVPVSEIVEIGIEPTQVLVIPRADAVGAKGVVRFRITEQQKAFLRSGKVRAGVIFKPLGRARLSSKAIVFNRRRDATAYGIRYDHDVLIVSGLPQGVAMRLQLFRISEDDEEAACSLPLAMTLGKEALGRDLPDFYETIGYSNFPLFDEAEDYYFDAPSYDSLLVCEFRIGGKALAPGAGLIVGQEYVCWIWDANKADGTPLLKLLARAGKDKIAWEESAEERLRSLIKLISKE